MPPSAAESVDVDLGDRLTIRGIGAAHEQLTSALQAHDHVRLCIAAEAEADLAFLQLIESARKYAESTRKRLQLAEPPSPRLASLIARSGLLASATPAQAAFWSSQEETL